MSGRTKDLDPTFLRRPLVTGGLGFIGSAFIRYIRPRVEQVWNIDLETYAGDRARLDGATDRTTNYQADVADPAVADVIREVGPTIVVHFAAESHVTRSETTPHSFMKTNVEGTENVLAAAANAGVKRFLHISTDEVYGPCLGDAFTEAEKEPGEGKATSPYARSKALADDLCLQHRSKMEVVVARLTNCFGPWQHPEKAIPRWITSALEDEDVPVWGDGLYTRSWLHVEDAVNGLVTLCLKGEAAEAYNIGPIGEDLPNVKIARSIAKLAGAPEERVTLTTYDRPQHDRRYSIDPTKISRLGWHPKRSLIDGLTETVAWYRDNREWWLKHRGIAEAIYSDRS